MPLRLGANTPFYPSIVHLVGYPGVGKYTVAKELVRLADSPANRFILIDNHLTANVVFSVLPVDGSGGEPLPRSVWDRVDDVRAVLRRTIREQSPPEWSFVFTNVVLDGDPVDARTIGFVRELAAARGSRYVPVRLHCGLEEHLRRVVDPGRADRGKWQNADAVAAYVTSAPLIELDDPLLLDLDVTDRSAAETAQLVLAHLESI